MTVSRTAAEVLDGHVTLEVESIDRMYLNLYQPQLQRELEVVGFFKERGFAFASGALMQPITSDLPWVCCMISLLPAPGSSCDDEPDRYLIAST